MESEKWKVQMLIDIAKLGRLTEEGQQKCANLIEVQQQEIERLKATIDEIKGIVGYPGEEALKKHGLTDTLPNIVRYLHREWLEQTHRAGQRCIEKDIEIDRLKDVNEQLRAQVARMREALEHIAEYWNRDNNEKAMEDACWHAIETAEEALSNDVGKDYHNPADVEALRQAREALIYCKISACKPAKGVAEVAIATIDKALGGNEDA